MQRDSAKTSFRPSAISKKESKAPYSQPRYRKSRTPVGPGLRRSDITALRDMKGPLAVQAPAFSKGQEASRDCLTSEGVGHRHLHWLVGSGSLNGGDRPAQLGPASASGRRRGLDAPFGKHVGRTQNGFRIAFGLALIVKGYQKETSLRNCNELTWQHKELIHDESPFRDSRFSSCAPQ